MDLFLGNKEMIGVETLSVQRDKNGTLTGYARLWIGGHFLGTIHDFIYMDGYLLGGLFQISRVPFLMDGISMDNSESLYAYLFKRLEDGSEDEIHNYLVNFGTMSDAFNVWAFKKGDNITIGWKLRDDYHNPYYLDLVDYPPSAFFHTLNYRIFNEFVERLERIFQCW